MNVVKNKILIMMMLVMMLFTTTAYASESAVISNVNGVKITVQSKDGTDISASAEGTYIDPVQYDISCSNQIIQSTENYIVLIVSAELTGKSPVYSIDDNSLLYMNHAAAESGKVVFKGVFPKKLSDSVILISGKGFSEPELIGTIDVVESSNCPSEKFSDVDKSAWYHTSIDYALNNRIMRGVSEDQFQPNTSLNRAMMAQILYNLEGNPDISENGIFTDVKDSDWYSDAVNWAASNRIVNGMGDNRFEPMQNLTREQMAALLNRYAMYKGYDVTATADLSVFTDESEISNWAVENLKWAVGSGLINGMGDGTLAPQGTATRSQVAALMMRFIEANK